MALVSNTTRGLHEVLGEWQRGVSYVDARVVPAVRASLAHLLRSSGRELERVADTIQGSAPRWRPVTSRMVSGLDAQSPFARGKK